ncbi:MAG TPA: 2-oxoacid:acceptor oxidoreductase family protein [bacterium]|nr:2-oxoacid:acceptor oxidoreductase family protein [bacterium]
MPEIRFHGRGGQGAVVASRLLAHAAAIEGNYVQAFPAFGLERRGAPVMAFTRIQEAPISNHSQIYEPDIVVSLDHKLLGIVDVTEGLKKSGILIVNTDKQPAELGITGEIVICTVNAANIAASNGLGTRMSPIVNTAILGALARASGCVSIENIFKAIEKTVKIVPQKNIEACRQAFEEAVIYKP